MKQLSFNDLVDRRMAALQKRAELVKQLHSKIVDSGEDRTWLEQFIKGVGLDIACGEFVLDGCVGVDSDIFTLGADYHYNGDELTFRSSESLDFIVTNYFEAFPNPLKALHEWHRILKREGTLAIICRNADCYTDEMGPLTNKKRQCVYTARTLEMYLWRAGYRLVNVSINKETIRAKAIK